MSEKTEEKEKILIIDCEKEIRSSLSKCLSQDFTVDTSPTFDSALSLIRDNVYNIVVTEIDTPEIKSIEVLRKLKEIKSEIPVIVVTTYQSVPLAVEAMKAGAYDYITKPFNFDELKMVILHALERQKLVKEAGEKKVFQELAILDGLTKIYNRRYFDELLQQEVRRAIRYAQNFSLLMIDVDDFKKYNDAYGHPAGDEVLKTIAALFLSNIRNTDYVARYGGEEFCIITPHTDKKGASALAARIVNAVANQNFVLENSKETQVTVSIGVAMFGEDAASKNDLVKRADEALYQAKKLGKNKVCMFGLS